jgi:hypothetical protein
MTAQELAQRLDAKRNGEGWKAKCPAHEDRTPSLSIKEGDDGRVLVRCFAGCALEDITRAMNIEVKDLFTTPRQFNREVAVSKDLSGGVESRHTESGVSAPAHCNTGPKDGARSGSSAPPAQISPLSAKQIEAVAKWRGYSQELVEWLNKFGLIGHFEGNIAFPVQNGVHFRKKDGSGWRYTQGAKPDLFVLGGIEEGALVHCFESQWDALAYADASGERTNIVATRGASNIRLLDRFLNFSGTLYLWPQNDAPGQKWARDIAHDINCQMKLAKIPSPHKDLNEWRKNGATDGDVFNAFVDAKDFSSGQVATGEHAQASTAVETTATENNSASAQPGEDYKLAPSSPAGKPVADVKAATSTQTRAPNEQAERLDSGCQAEASEAVRPEFHESVPLAAEPPAPTPGDAIPYSGAEVATGTVGERASVDGGPKVAKHPEVLTQRSVEPALSKTLDDTVAFLKRYVVFTLDEQADVLALWVAHSWTFASFRFTPYLNVCSPEKRCGKTRLLECIQLLVPKPRAMVRPTEAVLFRTIEKDKPTLLLDEVDTIYSSDADDRSEGLRAVLNAGFQAGPFSTIPRCVGHDLTPKDFNVFCPKVIAGIGKNLPDTVRDRSIEIRLIRQLGDEKASKFRAADAEKEVELIRAELDAWSRSSGSSLAAARPSMPQQLQDRQQDMMEPLVAIADDAGGEWPQRARDALVGLGATHEDQSTGVQLLADCRTIFAAIGRDKLTSGELIARLVDIESDNSPWPTWWEGDLKNNKIHSPARKLAKLLAPFDIKPATVRMGAGKDEDVAKGYYRNHFLDAWKRYLEPVKGMTTMELGL